MKHTYVSPSGNLSAKLAIVGEQPGVQEVREGRPFVGPAGRGLDECLVMAKIPRHSLYLTNVIKDLDKPLNFYINLNHNRASWSISTQGWDYIHELKDELKQLKPNVVVATGNVALIALTSRVGITNWRGSVLESTLVPGLKVIPTFHPATFIIPKFNFLNKPQIVMDLIKAKEESEFTEIHRTPRNVITNPTFFEACRILKHCYEAGLHGQTIDIDIEVINGEVDCIAFAWDSTHAISIPFKDSKGDYFHIEQEYEIMLLISHIIEDERISKRGANFIFDTQFILRKYGIRPRGELHCTQIAQKISFPDFKAGLDYVVSMYTDIPYYKQDGKQWIKMGYGSWNTWWMYNGLDAISTNDANPKQIQELIKQGNLETYNRQRKLIKPFIYMGERGIRIDVEKMIEYKDTERIKIDPIIEEFKTEVGHEINPNSPPQVMNYFYRELKIKPYKTRNTKGQYVETSDVNALIRIARQQGKGSRAAQCLLNIRRAEKRISTYLDVGKVDKDGRYRSAYKPVGTETGRSSSGKTIFGGGGNQQNWPHDLLRLFLFDEGYIGYSFDLSQIENRIVAYVGGVIPQIQAFEQGIDLHALTASFILGKHYSEISNEDGSSSIGDGTHSERFWGKKGNHATNYDVGYKTFALVNEITEASAKAILDRIHKAYPQIRGGFHVIIQEMLRRDRYVTNLFGRKRLFLGPILPSYPNVRKSDCLITYREAYAQLPQSTCADKINEQGIEFIYYNQQWFKPIELLTAIHDSIVFQIPKSVPLIEHARMLLRIKDSLETPLIWHDKEVPTPVDLCIGFNLCKDDMKELKSKQISNDVREFADKLTNIIKELEGG